jgi:hypothetical protein
LNFFKAILFHLHIPCPTGPAIDKCKNAFINTKSAERKTEHIVLQYFLKRGKQENRSPY